MQSSIIRKISIGPDLINSGMHFQIGQKIYGGHEICDIRELEDRFEILIKKDGVVKLWKSPLKTMPIVLEYDLDYD